MQPELHVIVRLEESPRAFPVTENAGDAARLLDDLDGRDDLPQEIAEAVGEAMHAMRGRVESFESGNVS